MTETFDINKEYEKIFGTESRKNIFNPDDDDYEALRKSILEAKREFRFKKSLPFDGVKLLSYDEFQRSEKYDAHQFFIKRNAEPTRFCNVFGTYDKTSQKFTMEQGSILSFETTPSYTFTPQGLARRNFLDMFCSKEAKGYRLRNDYLFNSPSAAASFAIGNASNGWVAWKDKEGNTLAEIYRCQ